MSTLYHSPNLIIREFLAHEQSTFLDLFKDDLVTQFLPEVSAERYEEMFDELLKNYQTGKLSRWGIFDGENNNFIGMCVARIFAHNSNQLEIGYVLSRAYWGKGIATEVCKALTHYGFANTDKDEVVAITALDNSGSQNVLRKTGFEQLPNLLRQEEEMAYFRITRPLL